MVRVIVTVMGTVTEGYGDGGDRPWKVMDGHSNWMATLRWFIYTRL